MNPDLQVTGEGLPSDIEQNVLKLCQRAFQDTDLKFVQEPRDVDTGDISEARLSDLPAMRVWVNSFTEDANHTGASLGRKQREKLTFNVSVVYASDYGLPADGDARLSHVGWHLREKLTENTTLFGLCNMGADIHVSYGSDVANLNDSLVVASCVIIEISYKLVRMKRRATPNG